MKDKIEHHEVTYDKYRQIVEVDGMQFSIELLKFMKNTANEGKKFIIENMNGQTCTIREIL